MNREENIKKLNEALKDNNELQLNLKNNPIKVLQDFNIHLTEDELEEITGGTKGKPSPLLPVPGEVMISWPKLGISFEAKWEA